MTTVLKTACLVSLLAFSWGCEEDFGAPCEIPAPLKNTCSTSSSGGEESEGQLEAESRSSCAIDNYAGCATRVCLQYRDSSAYCSQSCRTDGDCPGSAACRPIIGGGDVCPEEPFDESGFPNKCYCVRKGDLNN
ncbi:MAG: hypothetical protein ACE366_26005 [Bradymonadia bacterium]